MRWRMDGYKGTIMGPLSLNGTTWTFDAIVCNNDEPYFCVPFTPYYIDYNPFTVFERPTLPDQFNIYAEDGTIYVGVLYEHKNRCSHYHVHYNNLPLKPGQIFIENSSYNDMVSKGWEEEMFISFETVNNVVQLKEHKSDGTVIIYTRQDKPLESPQFPHIYGTSSY